MTSETVMSAHCRLCEERVERDEAAVVGEHLVCGECCARVGVQARPVLERMAARRRQLSPALRLAVMYAAAGEDGRGQTLEEAQELAREYVAAAGD